MSSSLSWLASSVEEVWRSQHRKAKSGGPSASDITTLHELTKNNIVSQLDLCEGVAEMILLYARRPARQSEWDFADFVHQCCGSVLTTTSVDTLQSQSTSTIVTGPSKQPAKQAVKKSAKPMVAQRQDSVLYEMKEDAHTHANNTVSTFRKVCKLYNKPKANHCPHGFALCYHDHVCRNCAGPHPLSECPSGPSLEAHHATERSTIPIPSVRRWNRTCRAYNSGDSCQFSGHECQEMHVCFVCGAEHPSMDKRRKKVCLESECAWLECTACGLQSISGELVMERHIRDPIHLQNEQQQQQQQQEQQEEQQEQQQDQSDAVENDHDDHQEEDAPADDTTDPETSSAVAPNDEQQDEQ